MDCANMNFDNTVFAFTRIMWLSNPTKHLAALVADWPCRAVLSEFVKTCSVVFEGHFEFFVQVDRKFLATSVSRFFHCVKQRKTSIWNSDTFSGCHLLLLAHTINTLPPPPPGNGLSF